jgi:hypothetical protein
MRHCACQRGCKFSLHYRSTILTKARRQANRVELLCRTQTALHVIPCLLQSFEGIFQSSKAVWEPRWMVEVRSTPANHCTHADQWAGSPPLQALINCSISRSHLKFLISIPISNFWFQIISYLFNLSVAFPNSKFWIYTHCKLQIPKCSCLNLLARALNFKISPPNSTM